MQVGHFDLDIYLNDQIVCMPVDIMSVLWSWGWLAMTYSVCTLGLKVRILKVGHCNLDICSKDLVVWMLSDSHLNVIHQ